MATLAEIRARKLAKINEQLAQDKRKELRRKKENRLAWRRAYWKRKKQEPAPNAAADNLAVLVADRGEQKRAGKHRWRLQTCAGVKEERTLAEWSAEICSQSGASITPVELEAILRDERHIFRSISQIVEYLKSK